MKHLRLKNVIAVSALLVCSCGGPSREQRYNDAIDHYRFLFSKDSSYHTKQGEELYSRKNIVLYDDVVVYEKQTDVIGTPLYINETMAKASFSNVYSSEIPGDTKHVAIYRLAMGSFLHTNDDWQFVGIDWPPVINPVKQQNIAIASNTEKNVLAELVPLGNGEFKNEKDGSILVKVVGCDFIMGSDNGPDKQHALTNASCDGWYDEMPEHLVHLDTYFIGKYEVTNSQYYKFCKATDRLDLLPTRADLNSEYFNTFPDNPITGITWNDAARYCKWAGLRLPTEAEWEMAARGSDKREFPWGNEWNEANCNIKDNSDNMDYLKRIKKEYGISHIPMPVGSFPADESPHGAYDMAGNVNEMCYDYWGYKYAKSDSAINNPKGPSNGTTHVVRGGNFEGSEGDGFTYYRDYLMSLSDCSFYTGFRVAR